MFAEIAVPVHVRQTFTYRLPGEMASRAGPGCRVIVPFGKRLLTGFIVEVHEGEPAELTSIKDVQELLDDSPVFGRDIIDLTRWMSEYYYASWGECLRSALPSGSLVPARKMITITEGGRAAAEGTGGRSKSGARNRALALILDAGSIELKELASLAATEGVSAASVPGIVRGLERAGYVRVSQQTGDSALRPKLQNVVSLKAGAEAAPAAPGSTGPEPPGGPAHPRDSDTDPSAATERPPYGGAGAGPSRKGGKKKRDGAASREMTPQQKAVIDFLSERREPWPLSDLLNATGVSVSTVRTLEKRGRLEVRSREVRRDPLAHVEGANQLPLTILTQEQQGALAMIQQSLDAKRYAAFLLHGVTGSGKTEIYIRAMAEAIARGRTALMLTPEISLTPILARRLKDHFGDAMAILHSNLSDGERVDEWRRIKAGLARVVLGTRSAVFAPLEDLGIVVVDEEHDTSYKQDESPRYNGRDTAIMRASNAGAVAVLGSATPSLESFHNAQSGKYIYIRLHSRYGNKALAGVRDIDMREVFKRHGKQQVFSDELLQAIGETHARGEQVMVLLNRRGFSSFLLCRSCGNAIHCPNCDVTLTFHKYNLSLQCHYCNYIRPVPKACPACEGQYVHYVGEGTEQIELRLHDLFPAMRIARLDRDTTRRRGSMEHVLMEFAAGTFDMLVGTQMIAKGHDFPNVTLVGVISVDAGLGLPDFRASERTFQLLTQVAGRAGRGDQPGKVIIQTYHPEHYAVVTARAQDYDAFYKREITFRQTMRYPPFTALVNVLVHDKDRERAHDTAGIIARELRQAAADRPMQVLGPAPAALSRLRNEYRFQVLVKTRSRRGAREALDIALDRALAAGCNSHSISIEVDPANLM